MTRLAAWLRRTRKPTPFGGVPDGTSAANATLEHLMRLIITALGVSGAALAAGLPPPAIAQQLELPYPWCSVGDRPRCDFMTHQQCEESTDYRGFCEPNPEMPPQYHSTPRRSPAQ